MSNEFLVDCIMCNWDAYGQCNSLIIEGKSIRVDVGGCLNYRAMGANRESFLTNIDDHDTIPKNNPDFFKFDDITIQNNMELINTANDKFKTFKSAAMKSFTNIITKINLPRDSGTASDYVTFINNSIDIIKQRLAFYHKNGKDKLLKIAL